MSEAIAELLSLSTARIDVDGEVSGTGFVVAPGKVLTCHHVVKRALDRPGAHQLIDVVLGASHGTQEERLQPLDLPTSNVANDLALLTVDPTAAHTVAYLGDAPRLNDELYAYGYPPTKRHGTSGTYRYEGPEGGPPRLLKIKAGQILSGLSGSPLLDMRTGTVVGVVRRSRDVESDLGGLAIPIDVAFAVFDRLRLENGEAQRRDGRWRRCLTADQRASLDGDPTPAGPTRRLLVDVGQLDDRWTVGLSSASPDDDWGSDLRIDLNVLRPDVARLFRMLKATNRLTQTEQSKVVGQALAKALWTDDTQQHIRDLLAVDGLTLDIALHFRNEVDDDLEFLPWETLHLPAPPGSVAAPGAVWLGADRRTTLVRVMQTHALAAPTPHGTCRVAVFRSPDDEGDPQLRVAQAAAEVARLAQVLGDVTQTPRTADEHATTITLHEVLRTRPTILHLVARARVERALDIVELDDSPSTRPVHLTAEELAEAFDIADVAPPTLVVLHPVRVSESELPPDLTVFARRLIDVGVHAVLAFPLPIDAEVARTFFEPFYRTLTEGAPVQVAVQRGRQVLERVRRHWSFPVLVTQAPGAFTLTTRHDPGGAEP